MQLADAADAERAEAVGHEAGRQGCVLPSSCNSCRCDGVHIGSTLAQPQGYCGQLQQDDGAGWAGLAQRLQQVQVWQLHRTGGLHHPSLAEWMFTAQHAETGVTQRAGGWPVYCMASVCLSWHWLCKQLRLGPDWLVAGLRQLHAMGGGALPCSWTTIDAGHLACRPASYATDIRQTKQMSDIPLQARRRG